MKTFIVILILLAQNANVLAQGTHEEILVKYFFDLNDEKIYQDEIAMSFAKQNFSKYLKFTLENFDITTFYKFKEALDSLNSDFTIKKSETGSYELFTLRNNFDHWNYILKDKVVINEAEKTFDYFYEIHSLPNESFADEYLLIKRMDEMSFTCYEAQIYSGNIRYGYSNKTKSNIAGSKVLSVCSWTNIDQSYPGKPDPVTGIPIIIDDGIVHYEPTSIFFDSKKKTISYSFISQKNGKQIIRKAKYKNGKFNIKDYDARTFEE